MITIDSCGWLEYYTAGPLAEEYGKYLKDLKQIITPTIIIYEVYKKIKREYSEAEALTAIGPIHKTRLISLDAQYLIQAADISLQYGLPMADAMVYTVTSMYGSQIVTSDKHFKGLEMVIYLERSKG
ncbi:PIN domain protein [Neomoorella glycerini]|uniref:PIN domain protein n=1 Tax=Neomoorella glycerini TaxID=55779 RepID=A0A6I5ZTT8_9FIRM|nr:type II toxin-antitoxin system VapC family toxin [Moorella glycerini]QGP92791.1 PIN domain protein [Moorella glycerini]